MSILLYPLKLLLIAIDLTVSGAHGNRGTDFRRGDCREKDCDHDPSKDFQAKKASD